MGSYGRLLKYIALIKTEIAIKVALGLIISATYIFQAIVMAKAVDIVFSGGSFVNIIPHIIIAVFAVLARGLFSRIIEIHTKLFSGKIKTKIRLLVFDKILRLGPGYLNDKRSGELLSLVFDGIESLEPFLVNYVPHLITIAISGIGIGIYLANIDLLTGIFIIMAVLLCVGVPYLTVPLVRHSIVSYWRNFAALHSQYVDSLQGMPTLKVFNASIRKGNELALNATEFYHSAIRNTTFSLIDSGLMTLLMSLVSCISVALAAFRTEAGIINITSVSAFLFLAVECARPISDLNMYWHTSFLGLSVADSIFGIIDKEVLIKEKENADCQSLNILQPAVKLHNVTFSYRQGVKILKNISISIEAGETVAIVGCSGSGKSTIVNLLLRFFDPDEGAIYIGEVNIRNYSIDYLQSKISVVFQETYLFSGTIEENIKMAKPDSTFTEVRNAAQIANADNFIISLPDGYKTVVGERGATLSGGERQRIAIARAVLKNTPLLILDEATASVDAKAETLIQQSLENLTKNRTTIIIAHRLSTIKNASKIYVLGDGHLEQEGTHEQLMAHKGIYANLVAAQEKE
jgi:ABC-type multidrug transport system fused ATPase/permease subunit